MHSRLGGSKVAKKMHWMQLTSIHYIWAMNPFFECVTGLEIGLSNNPNNLLFFNNTTCIIHTKVHRNNGHFRRKSPKFFQFWFWNSSGPPAVADFARKIKGFFHFLSKNSTLISRENCQFFFGWKTRENVVVLDFLAVDNFDFTRKIVKNET